ncbi:hypothetical protein E4U41_000862 [Claviceps citrina]|nr:hypothetical protein E4U41_000862 [Claviceps citrina]
MPPPTNRDEILATLRAQVAQGKPIIGAGAGIGLSAKSTEDGGADLIIVYNSGRFRMAGRGSLAGLMPYGNANDVVVDMPTQVSSANTELPPLPKKANEVLPIVRSTPVLAGVCATDPLRNMPSFLKQLREMGFAGVQNFPTVGLVDGTFRAHLEQTGMSYDAEVDMIAQAHAMGMLTTPYVFNAAEAGKMARAGADLLVAHMGLTMSGTGTGAGTASVTATSGKSLDECVALVQEIRDAAVEVRPDVLVLCHGGPIAGPDDAQYVLSRTVGVHGFYGASSIERLPVETAIAETTRRFKGLEMKAAAGKGGHETSTGR